MITTMKEKKATGRPTKKKVQQDTEAIADLVDALAPASELGVVPGTFKGLTDQQQYIMRLKLKGLSQTQIGKLLKISQPAVSQHVKRIRNHMRETGRSVDQALKVGETTSIYDEVEAKAWEIHVTGDSSEKLKALQIVMQARERQTKLLMDLGLLEKAATKTVTEHKVSPLVEAWKSGEAKKVVNSIIASQLSELEEPVPPEEEHIEDFPEEFEDDDD